MEYRLVQDKDIKQLYDLMNYYINNTNYTFAYNNDSYDKFSNDIKQLCLKYPYYVAVDNDVVAGYCCVHPMGSKQGYQHSVELTVYINPQFIGQHIGYNLLDILFKQLMKQNINTVYSCITATNQGSIDFHKRLGFKQVGYFDHVGYKNEQWLDVVWMSKTILDYTNQQDFIALDYKV